MLFAGGIIQAVAAAAGGGAPAVARKWQATCSQLWLACASVGLAAAGAAPASPLATVVAPAIAAVDAWAVDTGAPIHSSFTIFGLGFHIVREIACPYIYYTGCLC